MARMTKLFKCGNSMAVRLPKDFKLKGNIIEIKQRGDEIILHEMPQNLSAVLHLFHRLPTDFFSEGRVDTKPQKRKAI